MMRVARSDIRECPPAEVEATRVSGGVGGFFLRRPQPRHSRPEEICLVRNALLLLPQRQIFHRRDTQPAARPHVPVPWRRSRQWGNPLRRTSATSMQVRRPMVSLAAGSSSTPCSFRPMHLAGLGFPGPHYAHMAAFYTDVTRVFPWCYPAAFTKQRSRWSAHQPGESPCPRQWPARTGGLVGARDVPGGR